MRVTESDGADDENEFEEFEDDEFDGAQDDADDSGGLTPCPQCGRKIHEEAQKCEFCGQYATPEFAPWRRPWWLVVGVVICLFTIYLWMRH
jgi:hypothetical protein